MPDKQDCSWEVGEIIGDRQKRAEALKEVMTSTSKIYELYNQNPENNLDFGQRATDGITEMVNVITISSALVAAMIKNRKK